MAVRIEEGKGRLSPEYLEFFTKGNTSLEKSIVPKPYDWIPEQGWQDLLQLQNIPSANPHPFSDVVNDFSQNEAKWKTFYDHEARSFTFREIRLFPRRLKKSLCPFTART